MTLEERNYLTITRNTIMLRRVVRVSNMPPRVQGTENDGSLAVIEPENGILF